MHIFSFQQKLVKSMNTCLITIDGEISLYIVIKNKYTLQNVQDLMNKRLG